MDMSVGARKDCSRLQCRFWVCLVLLGCICLFAACILVPPAAISISYPGGRVRHDQARITSPEQPHFLFVRDASGAHSELPKMRRKPLNSCRKLLSVGENFTGAADRVAPSPAAATGGALDQLQRMGDEGCSIEDIAIVQGEIGPMPDGIPSFSVQILNLCLGGCPIRDIHVSCGWFASATLVNPSIFRRVEFDDCVVKGGHALAAGETLTFQYSNSFQFPFSLSSASFSCH